jgi:hypothetical protein
VWLAAAPQPARQTWQYMQRLQQTLLRTAASATHSYDHAICRTLSHSVPQRLSLKCKATIMPYSHSTPPVAAALVCQRPHAQSTAAVPSQLHAATTRLACTPATHAAHACVTLPQATPLSHSAARTWLMHSAPRLMQRMRVCYAAAGAEPPPMLPLPSMRAFSRCTWLLRLTMGSRSMSAKKQAPMSVEK